MSTPENTVTHWRDLTDQLDAGDIARLTIHERAEDGLHTNVHLLLHG